jgi:hypothetical protein
VGVIRGALQQIAQLVAVVPGAVVVHQQPYPPWFRLRNSHIHRAALFECLDRVADQVDQQPGQHLGVPGSRTQRLELEGQFHVSVRRQRGEKALHILEDAFNRERRLCDDDIRSRTEPGGVNQVVYQADQRHGGGIENAHLSLLNGIERPTVATQQRVREKQDGVQRRPNVVGYILE